MCTTRRGLACDTGDSSRVLAAPSYIQQSGAHSSLYSLAHPLSLAPLYICARVAVAAADSHILTSICSTTC